MTTFGQELIRSAREALEIARGERKPAFVLVQEEIDVAAIRKRKHMSQERFARTFGLAPSAVRDRNRSAAFQTEPRAYCWP